MAEENCLYAGAYPWDDGAHTFTASELSMMAPGVGLRVQFHLKREFGLSTASTRPIWRLPTSTSQYMVLDV